MTDPGCTAEAFAAAVERVTQFRGRVVVVKLGGSAMEDPAATEACLRSVVTLQRLGVLVVLVHGGGKPIDRAMAEAGLTPRKVAGRRYTDDDTLRIVVRVLTEINAGLVEQIQQLGGEADPYAPTGGMTATRLTLTGPEGESIDLGRVGRVTRVHTEVYQHSFDAGEVAVVPSLALNQACVLSSPDWADDPLSLLNVNADTAASAVAGALQADKAIFLTDTPGVLRDRSDPASLLPRLTAAECRELIAQGVIDGGMVPKVEACFEALDAGAKSALILDGRVPYSLLDVFLKDTFTGTEITR